MNPPGYSLLPLDTASQPAITQPDLRNIASADCSNFLLNLKESNTEPNQGNKIVLNPLQSKSKKTDEKEQSPQN